MIFTHKNRVKLSGGVPILKQQLFIKGLLKWCLSHGIAINGKQLTNQSNDGRIVLVVDGGLGPQTYKRLQQFLGVDQTGIFDDNTITKLQKFLDVSVDGIFGPNSTKALQQLVGASVDGEWGSETTSKLQTWLNNN